MHDSRLVMRLISFYFYLFLFVYNHALRLKLGFSSVTSFMLLIRYKSHEQDDCCYVKDRTDSPLVYTEDGKNTFFRNVTPYL